MKARRVFVTLEVETTASVAALRRPFTWNTVWELSKVPHGLVVLQAQANVARATPKKKRRLR